MKSAMALRSAALSCVLLGSPVWAQESLPTTFGPPEEIRPPRDPSGQVHSIATGDLDGDGDLDLVTGSIAADEVAWFRNDGTGTFGEAQILTQTVNGVHTVAVADLDGDGDIDHEEVDYRADFVINNELSWVAELNRGEALLLEGREGKLAGTRAQPGLPA